MQSRPIRDRTRHLFGEDPLAPCFGQCAPTRLVVHKAAVYHPLACAKQPSMESPMTDPQGFYTAVLTAGAILTGFAGTFLQFRIQREASYHRQPAVSFEEANAKDVFIGLTHFRGHRTICLKSYAKPPGAGRSARTSRSGWNPASGPAADHT